MASLADFVAEAMKFRGDPYVFGAAGPKAFDCSGLVYYAMRQLGDKSVPRTSEEQWSWSQHITEKQLSPGDLIFEQWPGDQAAPGHVVIYLGHGKILQAPQTGQLVQVDSFSPASVQAAGGRIVGYGRPRGLTGGAADTAGSGGTPPALGLSSGLTAGAESIPGFGFLPTAITNIFGAGQTIGDIATGIGGIANDLGTIIRFMSALFRPNMWLRVGAFVMGLIFAGLGLYTLSKAIGIDMPKVTPIPV